VLGLLLRFTAAWYSPDRDHQRDSSERFCSRRCSGTHRCRIPPQRQVKLPAPNAGGSVPWYPRERRPLCALPKTAGGYCAHCIRRGFLVVCPMAPSQLFPAFFSGRCSRTPTTSGLLTSLTRSVSSAGSPVIPRCARTSHVEPRAVDRPGPGHAPSLPRLAHADGFPFSRSAA
jgi:hypothetical protein